VGELLWNVTYFQWFICTRGRFCIVLIEMAPGDCWMLSCCCNTNKMEDIFSNLGWTSHSRQISWHNLSGYNHLNWKSDWLYPVCLDGVTSHYPILQMSAVRYNAMFHVVKHLWLNNVWIHVVLWTKVLKAPYLLSHIQSMSLSHVVYVYEATGALCVDSLTPSLWGAPRVSDRCIVICQLEYRSISHTWLIDIPPAWCNMI